jgi:LacI family transcriptional regulator
MAATIRDVARLARTSTATVSNVFSGKRKVSLETEARVRQAAARLGYVPNQAARTLATKSSQVIAVLVSDVANPFFAPMLRGVEEVARAHGYLVLVGDSNESVASEEEYLASLTHRYVDGMLLSPASERSRPPTGITDWEGRLVLVNRGLQGVNADLVTTNNRHGGALATSHLLAQGHEDIALIVGPQDVSTHADRLEGFRTAMADARVAVRSEFVKVVGLDAHSSYVATRELFVADSSQRPTALFTASAIHAMGAWQALLELGLNVPSDVSFITFDRPDWTDLVIPKITTVQQPGYEIGRSATQLLLQRVGAFEKSGRVMRPEHQLLEPTLQPGGSVLPHRLAGARREGVDTKS